MDDFRRSDVCIALLVQLVTFTVGLIIGGCVLSYANRGVIW